MDYNFILGGYFKNLINFKLQEIEKIVPWGREQNASLHWFGLTDGDLWLTFGRETIYEYTKEAIEHWEGKTTPYNNYYLSRFIEDFTEIFDKVRETIPEELYDLTKDLEKFQSDARKWLDVNDSNEDDNNDFYLGKYDKLISWTYQRSFNSSHLIGGPYVSFYRRNDKVRIVWETESTLDNGIKIWTANNGSCEMEYVEFVNKIKEFGHAFFAEMTKQVNKAISMNWGSVNLDKERLQHEHQERKVDFFSKLLLLEQEPSTKTNWTDIELLCQQMQDEIR